MIRVPIPIDLATVAETASGTFALATPLRIDRLLALAVTQAIGARAPSDKRERAIFANLAAFLAGNFVVDVDGRLYDRPEAVVVCCGIATLRFFSVEPGRRTMPVR